MFRPRFDFMNGSVGYYDRELYMGYVYACILNIVQSIEAECFY